MTLGGACAENEDGRRRWNGINGLFPSWEIKGLRDIHETGDGRIEINRGTSLDLKDGAEPTIFFTAACLERSMLQDPGGSMGIRIPPRSRDVRAAGTPYRGDRETCGAGGSEEE